MRNTKGLLVWNSIGDTKPHYADAVFDYDMNKNFRSGRVEVFISPTLPYLYHVGLMDSGPPDMLAYRTIYAIRVKVKLDHKS